MPFLVCLWPLLIPGPGVSIPICEVSRCHFGWTRGRQGQVPDMGMWCWGSLSGEPYLDPIQRDGPRHVAWRLCRLRLGWTKHFVFFPACRIHRPKGSTPQIALIISYHYHGVCRWKTWIPFPVQSSELLPILGPSQDDQVGSMLSPVWQATCHHHKIRTYSTRKGSRLIRILSLYIHCMSFTWFTPRIPYPFLQHQALALLVSSCLRFK